MPSQLTLFHTPYSRSSGVLTLLEELRAPHDLQVLNQKTGEQRQPAYLAVNPMGKVPAIRHEGVVVTEQVAIYLYLADLHAGAGLAPAIGDPLRGSYLRWMAFYGSCFEPAIVDAWMKRPPVDAATCPYGDFDTMFSTLTEQLGKGPYLLGETFSALDVLWGSALGWMSAFDLVPKLPVIADYVARIAARPASKVAAQRDAGLAAAQG